MGGTYGPLARTVRDFREIIEGKHDDVPEQAFYLVGTIDDVLKKADTLGGSSAKDLFASRKEA
jgi:F-type H+-transporting ATPase subunit beta